MRVQFVQFPELLPVANFYAHIRINFGVLKFGLHIEKKLNFDPLW